MSFDPNKETAKGLWATYIPYRSPKFKIHTNKGHATSAIKCQSYYSNGQYRIQADSKLYQRSNKNEEWQEVPIRYNYKDDESIIIEEKNE